MAKQYIEVDGQNIECVWEDGRKRKVDEVNIKCIHDYLDDGLKEGTLWQPTIYGNEYYGVWKAITR